MSDKDIHRLRAAKAAHIGHIDRAIPRQVQPQSAHGMDRHPEFRRPAGIIGIIPYFGVIVSTVPVLLLSLTHGDQMSLFGTELGVYAPVASLGVCALVLFLEKTVIQPKIIGDRVGMHPVAVIISVLMGTTLVGGVIGGLLAIPVAMALRTVLFRYVWVKRETPEKAVQMEVL